MSKLKHRFCFKKYIFFGILIFSCQQIQNSSVDLSFGIIDVGQGLSQIVQVNSDALIWDMGPQQCIEEWYNIYYKTGKPSLQAIVISHRDLDHSGGLQFLDSTVHWSGIIVVSKYEDTTYIKGLCTTWTKEVIIRTVCEGDTLGYLPGVEIRCIWPPTHIPDVFPVQGSSINKYSLVFLINYHGTNALISSDIDSVAAFSIATSYKEVLHSEILVVPHHGSAGSLNRVFLGYIQPEFAVISCGRDNQYNHPSETVVGFFRTLGLNIRITYLDKTTFFRSNGFYWKEY